MSTSNNFFNVLVPIGDEKHYLRLGRPDNVQPALDIENAHGGGDDTGVFVHSDKGICIEGNKVDVVSSNADTFYSIDCERDWGNVELAFGLFQSYTTGLKSEAALAVQQELTVGAKFESSVGGTFELNVGAIKIGLGVPSLLGIEIGHDKLELTAPGYEVKNTASHEVTAREIHLEAKSSVQACWPAKWKLSEQQSRYVAWIAAVAPLVLGGAAGTALALPPTIVGRQKSRQEEIDAAVARANGCTIALTAVHAVIHGAALLLGIIGLVAVCVDRKLQKGLIEKASYIDITDGAIALVAGGHMIRLSEGGIYIGKGLPGELPGPFNIQLDALGGIYMNGTEIDRKAIILKDGK